MFAIAVSAFTAHYNAPKLCNELGFAAFTKTVRDGLRAKQSESPSSGDPVLKAAAELCCTTVAQ